MPREGFKSATVRKDALQDLEAWRITRSPFPSESEAIALAIEFFLEANPRTRDAWVAKRRGDQKRE